MNAQYIIDEKKLKRNLAVIRRVQQEANVKIILALKSFANWPLFPMMRDSLAGCTASSPWEVQLGHEELGKEIHCYSPAYSEQDIAKIVPYSHSITFNSLGQLQKYQDKCGTASLGLRVNPEHQESKVAIYDPCAPGSRFGVKASQLIANQEIIKNIEGFHFHNLCESGADALERTLEAFLEKFEPFVPHLKWLNLGGGHFINHPDYDVEHLIKILKRLKEHHPHLEIYLEPGAGIVYDVGTLESEIMDIIENELEIVLLNVSATAHMPDVLEMPYRPNILGSGEAHEKKHKYRLASNSCLSGDIIGEYSFDKPLQIGDKIVFEDMIQYTMVKTTFFNGLQHPDIVLLKESGEKILLREFEYEDFRGRLG